jgi:hypothetical protein
VLQNIKSTKISVKSVVLLFFLVYVRFFYYLCALILALILFMRKRNQYTLLFLLLLLACPLGAQIQGSGSSVFNFLSLPVSSRLNALGGENVSISDGDVSMSYVNPALLNVYTDKVLQLNYAYYLAGTMFGSAIYGHNLGNNYFAGSIHFLDYGEMSYADENGNLLGGTFGAKDICLNFSYARQLGPYFRVGATIKPVFSVYESLTSFALGADVGGHFQTKDSTFQMGLALRNIGWQLKSFYEEDYGQHTEMLPLNLEFGLSYRLAHAPLRLSLTIHNLQCWDLAPIGSEVAWYDMLFRHTIWSLDIIPKKERFYLTISYNHRRQAEMAISNVRSAAGLSFGAGLRLYKFRIGFSMSQYTVSNFTYQVSLSTDINQFLK